MLNSLDDQYTILYKYVEQYQYPKKFLTLIDNQIYTIFDYFDQKRYDLAPYFNSQDLTMIYFESFFDMTSYKQWLLKSNQKKYKKLRRAINSQENLASYETKDIINYYHQKYKRDDQFDQIMSQYNDIIYLNIISIS